MAWSRRATGCRRTCRTKIIGSRPAGVDCMGKLMRHKTDNHPKEVKLWRGWSWTAPWKLTFPSFMPFGCTYLQHPTSHARLTSPTTCHREFVCGTCIGTAQVGASLVAPLGFIFEQSSLRSSRDVIIIPCHVYLYWLYSASYSRVNTHGTPPYPSCLLPCIVEMYAYRHFCETYKYNDCDPGGCLHRCMYMSRTHHTWCWCQIKVWWQYFHRQWRHPLVRFHTLVPVLLNIWCRKYGNV